MFCDFGGKTQITDYRTSKPFGKIKLTGKKKRNCVEKFSTYARFFTSFTKHTQLFNEPLNNLLSNPEGYSVLEAFYCVETFGCSPFIPCTKPLVLYKGIIGKRQLNWQIEQWSNGYGDWTLLIEELREWYPWLPEWVFEAVIKQGEPKKIANMLKEWEAYR